MENKKPVFITIIILLIIFVPLTIIGFLTKTSHKVFKDNPNHELYYDGKLWFYDESNNLINTYVCKTEKCELTKPTINDDEYDINYYKNGTLENIPVSNNTYAFITDGVIISLYNISLGKSMQTYKEVKNYNINLQNNVYILKNNDDLWGVLSVSENLRAVLPFEYDFIGLKTNNVNENNLLIDKYIVLQDNHWFLVDSTNNVLSGKIENPIIDYDEKYLFSKIADEIKIYDYEGNELLDNYIINDYIISDGYYGIITDNYILIYKELNNAYLKLIPQITKDKLVELEKDNNKLVVKVDGNIIENIEINN